MLGVLGGAFARLLWPITAIYLILDDLAVFFEGGDSVLGMLLNYTDTVMEDFQDIFKGFKEGNPLSALLKSFVDFSNLKIQPPPIITSLIAAGTAIVSIIENLNKFKDKINDNGTATGGAAPLLGYTGELPNLDNMFVTPAMQRNLSYSTNNTSNTDNRQINQNISIQSSQPVFDIQNQLAFARNAITSGW